MTQFNPDIADMLASRFRDLTFEKDGTSGYAVADKSYGFDTIYLAARFISRFSRDGYYHKHELVAKSDAYFRDLFMLGNTGQVPNYMTESLALFCFTGISRSIKGVSTASKTMTCSILWRQDLRTPISSTTWSAGA